MNRNFLILFLSVLVLSTTALGYEGQDLFGEYYITVGEPDIDGIIGPNEWDDAKWLPLDLCYSDNQGVPCPDDLFDASWAALWSPATNRFYVVVTGRDTDHVFGECYCDGTDYNKYDLVEVYVDANNNDTNPYQLIWNDEGQEMGNDYAQQWMTGYDGNEGWWCVPPQWPDYNDDIPLAAEYIPDMAVTLNGDILTYEYAIQPYKSFGWLTGRETVEVQLEADLQVGLDVVIGSRDGSFGTLCENAYDGTEDFDLDGEPDGVESMTKWDNASRFLDHWLVLDVNQAWRPRPGNKAVGVPGNVTLQWNAGRNSGGHDVYLGTSFEEVDNATDPNLLPVGRGRQALGNKTHTPVDSPLKLDTTYYWRIDEVNSTHPGQSWKGNVWRFTTGDYIVVEDFESYDKDNPLVYIEDGIWVDGWTNDTGSGLYLETGIARDGQSARFDYQNSGYFYSEAKVDLDDLGVYSDWLATGVKALSLWFYGEPDNSATVHDEMYVALEDTGGHLAVVPYDGDAGDVKLEMWQNWNIRLEDFNEFNDVDLSSVASIYIGFGDRYGTTSDGGIGSVYFDDIAMYLSRCIPGKAVGDATGDCFANYDDLLIMAGDWLESEFTVPVSAPDGNELVWYKFDHDGGISTAVDSSGNGHNGTITDADWITEGAVDGALNFDGIATQVEVPLDALETIGNQVTIALWQYGDPAIQPKADNLFEVTRTHGNMIEEPNGIRVLNAHVPYSDEMIIWCAGNPNEVYSDEVWDDCERIEKKGYPKEYEGKWNHWTFIKDCDAGVLEMYLNGFLWDSGSGFTVPINNNTYDYKEFLIGYGADGFYDGAIDDFRIYDKVLTQEEIWYLASQIYDGEGYYPLQDRETNFNEAGESAEKIDLMDFAVIADRWFEEQIWP